VIQTLYCYRKLTSVTVTAAPNTATTISLGCAITVANNSVPKIALPFKPSTTASLKNVTMVNAGTQPTFTKNGAPYWNISAATNALAGSPVGFLYIIVDDDETNA
jgi:hypothetical protein